MEFNLIEKQHEFLRQLEHQGKSFNTVKNYKADLQCFNTFLVQKQNHLKFQSFTSTQAQEYSHYLDEKYGSPNSVRRRVQALRLFFDFLQLHNLFPENPIKRMIVSPKVLDRPSPTPYHEVLRAYLYLKAKIKESEGLSELVATRNVIIFHLIYGSGLKVSDMAKLLTSGILEGPKNFRAMVEHPKRDPYSVPLPAAFNEDFLLYKKLYSRHCEERGIEHPELLFNANPYRVLSGGLSPRGTELFFEELRRQIKTNITAKSLRQSCIFKWLGQNINHATIKEWLGVTPGYSLELYLEELKNDQGLLGFRDLEDKSVS